MMTNRAHKRDKVAIFLKEFFKEIKKAQEDGVLEKPSMSLTARLNKLLKKCLTKLFLYEASQANQYITSSLKRDYNVFVDKEAKHLNKIIKGFKLNDIQPKLAKEFRARLAITKELIENTNENHSSKISNRFIGWLSSREDAPGAEGLAKALNINEDIKKERKHQRMVLADQTRKMLNTFDNIVAEEYEAIAFVWSTRRDNRVVGNPAGKYPVATNPSIHGDHFKRQGQLYFLHDTWAIKERLVKTTHGDFKWADFKDGMPGMAINCRCYAKYVYDLEDVPKELLTDKAKEYLEQ